MYLLIRPTEIDCAFDDGAECVESFSSPGVDLTFELTRHTNHVD